jgi:outer membrane protein TolC
MVSRFAVLFFVIATSFAAKAQAPPSASMLPNVSYPELDKLIEAAKQNYPRVRAFNHTVDAAKINVKKARLGWFDLFTFSFLYSPNNSTTLVNPSILNGYQFGVFVNFGSLVQKPSLIKQAKAELAITQDQRDEYYLNLATMVRQRYFIYIQQLTILKLQIQAEQDAESNMEMAKHKFEKGEMTLDDYNKALGTLTDHTQAKIGGEGALLVAKSSLEELVGKKLEDVK